MAPPVPSMTNLKGYLAVICAAIMWAGSGTAGKALFQDGVTPFQLVQVRVTVACVLLALALAICDRSFLRIGLKDIPYFALLGAVIMALVQGSYFYAISKIQVVAAILLQYTSPIMVAFYSICFWGERLTLNKVVALVLSLVGCYLVTGAYNLELLRMNLEGVLVAQLSALAFATYTLLGERTMHRYRSWTVVFYALLFASVSWNILLPPFQFLWAGYSVSQWGYMLYVAIFGTLLSFGLFFVGVNYIRSTRATITSTLEPISAGIIAFLLLGETLELPQVIGGGLVIAAVVLLQLRAEKDLFTPELIRSGNRDGEGQA